ncbi:peptide-methionine (S)-S-oxide reductase MsrA [Novosphingobium sp. 9]|uniref:peptide-methionine (S)-S-oxide reductase MsrA n=1 Tax=Novosphingobium sp. 9 TaxID=2025349 RepID=UPI0021B59A04|nr:peptide-methionine (S)-S-oxide reductase MsrA [Novosphingobium sp. 9]
MPAKTAIAAIVLTIGTALGTVAGAATPGGNFPAPPPEPAASGKQVAVFAGGCFWGIEGVFQHVRGVRDVTAGYAGGTRQTANYSAVSTERTGHAEAVRVVYDPSKVSYGTLLRVFFQVAHDPTERGGQFPDRGPSYRSAVFPQSPQQAALAKAYIARIDAAHVFPQPLTTTIETAAFYPAETWHQDYLQRHPTDSYIRRYDLPKIARLRQTLPQLYR